MSVLLGRLPLQLVQFIEGVDSVIEHKVAQEHVQRNLEIIEGTKANVGQVRHVTLQCVFITSSANSSIVSHSIVLKRRILGIQATVSS